MALSVDDRIQAPPRDAYKVLGRGSDRLLIVPETGGWCKTNDVGEYILEHLLDGQRTVGEVITHLSQEYGLLGAAMQEAVMPFLEDTVSLGVCSIVNGHSCDRRQQQASQDKAAAPKFPIVPSQLWVHPTKRCNLRCAYCYYDSGRDEGTIDVHALERLFQHITRIQRETGRKGRLVISGGEPMLEYDVLVHLLEAAQRSGAFASIGLLTNGTVGTRQEFETLLSHFLTFVQVSIDGPDARTHDLLRSPGTFDKAVATLRMLRGMSEKTDLVISCTLAPANLGCAHEVVKLGAEIGADLVRFARVVEVGRGGKDGGLRLDNAELDAEIQAIMTEYRIRRASAARRGFLVNFPDLGLPAAFGGRRPGCGIGIPELTIAHDNTVYPCPSVCAPRYALGNLLKDTPEILFERAKDLSSRYCVDHIEHCRTCDLRYICGGGCRAQVISWTGDPLGTDPMLVDTRTGECRKYDALIRAMWQMPECRKVRQEWARIVC